HRDRRGDGGVVHDAGHGGDRPACLPALADGAGGDAGAVPAAGRADRALDARRLAAGRPGGGAGISTLGARRAGVAAAAGSLLLAAGVAAFAGNGLDGDMLRLAALVTVTALTLVLVAAAGWWPAGGWAAQALLGLLYLAAVTLRGPGVDTSAPAVAAA